MKLSRILHLLSLAGLAGLLGVFLTACASPSTAEPPEALKVQVNVPPTWNLLLDDRVAEAFVDRLRDVLYREGADLPVELLRTPGEPAQARYLLTINLTEWRINHAGNIDCTFNASLQSPRGTRALGLYTSTTMRWLAGPGRFGLSRAFDEAAEGALHELARDLAKSELWPGLRQRSPAE
jgi:hypothetical protein